MRFVKSEIAKAEVTSSNVVGYQKIALTGGKSDILGAQFNPISGEASIQDITVDGDISIEGVDMIMWWDSATATYSKAFYWGVDVAEEYYGVYNPDDEEYENPLGAGWGDGNAYVVEASLPAGSGFWADSENGGYLVVSGEVPSSGIVPLVGGESALICNPFPVDTDIQTIGVSGDISIEGVDMIMWWDAATGTYSKAFYWGVDVAEEYYGVYNPDDEEYENPLGAGWGDGNAYIIRATIPAGHGFWAESENGGNLVFQNPMSAAE